MKNNQPSAKWSFEIKAIQDKRKNSINPVPEPATLLYYNCPQAMSLFIRRPLNGK